MWQNDLMLTLRPTLSHRRCDAFLLYCSWLLRDMTLYYANLKEQEKKESIFEV